MSTRNIVFLNKDGNINAGLPFLMTSTQLDFIKPVFPGETVFVESEKVYFRFGKLKCKVVLKNEMNETVCDGFISGIQTKHNYERT